MLRYFVLAVCFLCNSANAVQWIKGKVTGIEVSYMPVTLFFSLDTGNTACPAGKTMKWESASAENNKVIHSTVLAAMLAGKKLNIVINDNDTTCVVRYIYILNE
ncbi:hypothetical protein CBP51_00505 [Cellvibrio mixtus]|uniref:Uncharacterized protein n=1 Tax=Cellvibrio mixtus TaxID=39650 RepID=A0A266Q875_9GAMM|nr:hypothetical protein [Cellvibrio mixtus]OZY85569.1 hypothetical protein CBP51_00505 [Cellvibrio mixtus]